MGQAMSFKDASLEERSDYDTVLRAVQDDGMNLAYAAVELKSNRRIVDAAVAKNPDAFAHAALAMRRDRVIALAMLDISKGQVYRYLEVNDKDIDLNAATWCGDNLELMSESSRSNKGIVKAAVSSNGEALEFASPELKDDKEIVLAAVYRGRGFRFASERLRADLGVIHIASKHDAGILKFVVPGTLDDDQILEVVTKNGAAFQHIPDHLKESKPHVMAAVAVFQSVYINLSPALQNDPDVVATLLENTTKMYQWLPLQYKTKAERVRCMLAGEDVRGILSRDDLNDPDMLAICVMHSRIPGDIYAGKDWGEALYNPLKFFDVGLVEKHLTEEMAIEAVTRNCYAYSHLPDRFKKSDDIQKIALLHWQALKILPKTPELCLMAVEADLKALPLVPGHVRRELKRAFDFQNELRRPCKAFLWGATCLDIAKDSATRRARIITIPLQKLNHYGVHYSKIFKKMILSFLGIEYCIHAMVGKVISALPIAIEIED